MRTLGDILRHLEIDWDFMDLDTPINEVCESKLRQRIYEYIETNCFVTARVAALKNEAEALITQIMAEIESQLCKMTLDQYADRVEAIFAEFYSLHEATEIRNMLYDDKYTISDIINKMNQYNIAPTNLNFLKKVII